MPARKGYAVGTYPSHTRTRWKGKTTPQGKGRLEKRVLLFWLNHCTPRLEIRRESITIFVRTTAVSS